MLHVQDVSEPARALHIEIEVVFARSDADGTASRVGAAHRLMVETSCQADVTCETQPGDGPSVVDSPHAGTSISPKARQ